MDPLMTIIHIFTRHLDSLLLASAGLGGESSSVAVSLLEALHSLVRRVSLSLTSVPAQSALVAALIGAFLPEQVSQAAKGAETTLSAAQLAFALGLIANAVACLDKSSALFQDMDAPGAGLSLCMDYALRSVSTAGSEAYPLKVFSSGSLADFGASQLIALIVNKVGCRELHSTLIL